MRTLATKLIVPAALAIALVAPTAAFARWDDMPYRPDPSDMAKRLSAALAIASPDDAKAEAADVAAATVAATADSGLATDLAYMREEERLAHDLYTALAKKWDARVFGNIAASEQKHTDSMAVLLRTYGVDDPAAGRSAGSYAYPELQDLYDKLLAQGSASLAEALKVGIAVEKTDIADLDERIARTDQADVLSVYRNLRAASTNHLRAFEGQNAGGATSAAGERRGQGQGARDGSGRGRGAITGSDCDQPAAD